MRSFSFVKVFLLSYLCEFFEESKKLTDWTAFSSLQLTKLINNNLTNLIRAFYSDKLTQYFDHVLPDGLKGRPIFNTLQKIFRFDNVILKFFTVTANVLHLQ